MVQVYLPMGYPIVTGNQFSNVIYQGNLVRLYTLPADPRTDAQLNQRRFLSDVAKMRSMLGAWGKEVCKSAMGSRWATVLFQSIKADTEAWWSNALAEWDSFAEMNRESWRTAAPYKACFNDLGQIYFCLCRVIYHAVNHFGVYGFDVAEWAETDSASALAWWSKDLTGVFTLKQNDIWVSGFYETGGEWTDVYNVGANNNWYSRAEEANGYGKFYIKARSFSLNYGKSPGWGQMRVSVNGVVHGTVDLNNSLEAFGFGYGYPGESTDPKRLMMVEVEAIGGKIGVDYIVLG